MRKIIAYGLLAAMLCVPLSLLFMTYVLGLDNHPIIYMLTVPLLVLVMACYLCE